MELSEKELKNEVQSCSTIRKYLEQQLQQVIATQVTAQENLRLATERKRGTKRKHVRQNARFLTDMYLC
jgi:hypothetical protein